jgi:hypothetical protein
MTLQTSVANSTTPGLEETRFASPTQLLALQKELAKDAAKAEAAPAPQPASGNKWMVPVGIGVAALAVVAIAVMMMRPGADAKAESAPTTAAAAPAAAAAGGAAAKGPDANAAALEKTTLQVDSVPPGAALVVDGQASSQSTPTTITFVGPGPHSLRLSKRGFVNQDVNLTAADLRRGSVSYTLTAVEATKVNVTIDSAYPVEVLNGSKVMSAASSTHQLSVPSGTKLRVLAREYLLDAPVQATGKSVEYHAPGIGRLTVLTKYETCNIKIGDRVLGFPPITRQPIASGQYRIDIACPNGQNPAGQFVTIAPNETATVRIF